VLIDVTGLDRHAVDYLGETVLGLMLELALDADPPTADIGSRDTDASPRWQSFV
jgi:hypothetical protein